MNDKTPIPRALPVPSSRLARLGRLGSMTAGIAGNMAVQGIAQLGQGQRPTLRNLLLTPQNVTRLTNQLAQMRGAAMKMGQLLSMDTGDVLPPELAQIMARLRDDAHIMPPAQLKKVLNANWPDGWLKSFTAFDVHPIAAASIGQVHRAQLKDGRDLAIKVQYPGVARSIDSDVANVGVLIRMSGLMPKGFDLGPYLQEARSQLHDETDYLREGTQLARFGGLLSEDADFVVPSLQPDWSTPEVLAMTHMSGSPIESATPAPQATRDRIATLLVELTLREMFVFGAMQTDPNFANYLYRPDTGQIVLLDFGAARDLNPTVVDQYRRLIRAGLADDAAALRAIAHEIEFIGEDTQDSHQEQIVRMMRLVFATLTKAPQVDFSDRDMTRQMQTEGLKLADDGFVPPPVPMDVLLLQRKLGGVFLLAARLGARVDVIRLLDRYLN